MAGRLKPLEVDLARREVLARRLVGNFGEAADQVFEEVTHRQRRNGLGPEI
jgi:hypothetical protein